MMDGERKLACKECPKAQEVLPTLQGCDTEESITRTGRTQTRTKSENRSKICAENKHAENRTLYSKNMSKKEASKTR